MAGRDARAGWRRHFRRHPVAFLFLAGVVLPLALGVGGLYSYLRSSVPTHVAVQTLQGLDATVRVAFDDYDVPSIVARSDRDAFYALGYLHAQNRMWQMEFYRRAASGRLSEIFGRTTLGTDKFMRTLGLRAAAVSALNHLPSEARQSLEAYAQGVNAWIGGNPVLPPEFQLFGVTPELWSPVDSLLRIKLMALDLGANYQDELRNRDLIQHLGMPRWRELTSFEETVGQDLIVTPITGVPQHNLLNYLVRVNEVLGLSGPAAGSNAWVVSGSHSQSGLPLLAGDPHLGVSAPSTFYLADLNGERLHVRGATLPGLPVVIFGQNQHVAWAGTNVRADVEDLFEERLHPHNDQLHLLHGEWRALQVRTELISVAPDRPAFLHERLKPIPWQVRQTEYGPMISDVLPHEGAPLSLRWTALAARDDSFDSFLRINYAQNAAQFVAALHNYVAPVLNFVYADRDGHIGAQVAGHIPMRAQGHGLTPQPAWSVVDAWPRIIRFNELPAVRDPPEGVIISANERLASGPLILSSNWQPPYRALRIRQMIDTALVSDKKLTAREMAMMQKDTLSLQAAEMMPFLKSLRAQTTRQAQLLALIRTWDLRMERSSPAAAIYHSWLLHFGTRVVEDDLAPDPVHEGRAALLQSEVAEVRPFFLRHLLHGEYSSWCNDRRTALSETCDAQGLRALDDVAEELEPLMGTDASKWRWSDVQTVLYPHSPLSRTAALARIFDREAPSDGGQYTVNVAWSRPVPGRGYVKTLGASYREVIDLGATEHNLFAIDLGQSGNVLSAHYDDWLEDFSGERPQLSARWRSVNER
jgi:penicillin G amidase